MAGIDERPHARGGIETGEEQGDEPVEAEIFHQQMPGAGQNILETLVRQHQRPQIRPGGGHQHGRTQAMAGDIPHHDQQIAGGSGNEIEIVAARGRGGTRSAGDVVARQLRRGIRKEPLLDFAGETKFLFLREKGAFGRLARLAFFRVLQLPVHRRDQPGHVPLHQVVLRAGLHGGHGGLFADGAGNDQERNIGIGGPDHFQRRRGAELRHVVVGENNLPRPVFQRFPQILGIVHAPGFGGIAAGFQLLQQQERIEFRVLDDESFQRFVR